MLKSKFVGVVTARLLLGGLPVAFVLGSLALPAYADGHRVAASATERDAGKRAERFTNGPFVYVGGEAGWILNSDRLSKGRRSPTTYAVSPRHPMSDQSSNSALRGVYHGP